MIECIVEHLQQFVDVFGGHRSHYDAYYLIQLLFGLHEGVLRQLHILVIPKYLLEGAFFLPIIESLKEFLEIGVNHTLTYPFEYPLLYDCHIPSYFPEN